MQAHTTNEMQVSNNHKKNVINKTDRNGVQLYMSINSTDTAGGRTSVQELIIETNQIKRQTEKQKQKKNWMKR